MLCAQPQTCVDASVGEEPQSCLCSRHRLSAPRKSLSATEILRLGAAPTAAMLAVTWGALLPRATRGNGVAMMVTGSVLLNSVTAAPRSVLRYMDWRHHFSWTGLRPFACRSAMAVAQARRAQEPRRPPKVHPSVLTLLARTEGLTLAGLHISSNSHVCTGSPQAHEPQSSEPAARAQGSSGARLPVLPAIL